MTYSPNKMSVKDSISGGIPMKNGWKNTNYLKLGSHLTKDILEELT